MKTCMNITTASLPAMPVPVISGTRHSTAGKGCVFSFRLPMLYNAPRLDVNWDRMEARR
jgi:hypothetical protein